MAADRLNFFLSKIDAIAYQMAKAIMSMMSKKSARYSPYKGKKAPKKNNKAPTMPIIFDGFCKSILISIYFFFF
jgi:hypothetical protein